MEHLLHLEGRSALSGSSMAALSAFSDTRVAAVVLSPTNILLT